MPDPVVAGFLLREAGPVFPPTLPCSQPFLQLFPQLKGLMNVPGNSSWIPGLTACCGKAHLAQCG